MGYNLQARLLSEGTKHPQCGAGSPQTLGDLTPAGATPGGMLAGTASTKTTFVKLLGTT